MSEPESNHVSKYAPDASVRELSVDERLYLLKDAVRGHADIVKTARSTLLARRLNMDRSTIDAIQEANSTLKASLDAVGKAIETYVPVISIELSSVSPAALDGFDYHRPDVEDVRHAINTLERALMDLERLIVSIVKRPTIHKP